MMGVAVGGATAGDVVRGALGVEGACRRGVVCAQGGNNAVRACANGRLIYVFTGEVTLRSPVGYKASPADLTWGMSSPGDGA